ncbi:MAG: MmgE/PrpD family protein [Streptosporangiales bacterium]|nr:MmgE/PrpD family protein [Streptosporangiales bacterium]
MLAQRSTIRHNPGVPVHIDSQGATALLAREVAALSLADLPPGVRTAAKLCVLDVLGVAIAGSREPVTEVVRTALAADGTSAGTGDAAILGRPESVRALDAALVNGTAAHALDFDDVAAAMGGHPSAPVLPAALAVAQSRGLSGAALLTAFAAGFEVECRIGAALTGHYERGFHTTATVGTLGAAAAAARLMRLDAEATARALGIAATQAAGLKAMFGTMCKPLHAGRAASAGVLAALLAEQGMTSADEPLTAHQGLAETQADGFDDTFITPFGEPWYVPQALFKMHASCYLTHAPINALLRLREEHPELPEETDTVELRVSAGHLHVCAIPEPRTALEGKFSLRFTAALALAEGTADESRFTTATVTDPRLTALRDRVTVVPDEHLTQWNGTVTVTTSNGATYRGEADTGTPNWVDDPGEQTPGLLAKFHGLTEPHLGEARAKKLSSAVLALDTLEDLTELTTLASPLP